MINARKKESVREEKKWDSSLVEKEIKAVITVLIMLFPGFFLDAVYYRVIKCDAIYAFFHYVFLLTGVTYQTAFEKLNGMLGILMTIVSLFLATNINLEQRRTADLYGIPRSELFLARDRKYRYTRRVSYLAPLLIVVFLNLSMCITGYLLYFYCYTFYILFYQMHEQSYNEERDRKYVVDTLVKKYVDANLVDGALIVQLFCERVGSSLDRLHNWNSIQILYKDIVNCLPERELERRYIFTSSFFGSVYFGKDRIHEAEATKFIREFLYEFDSQSHVSWMETKWIELFSILEIAIIEMEEDNLLRTLEWLRDFKWRNKRLQDKDECENTDKDSKKNPKQVQYDCICFQRTIIVIFLECRMYFIDRICSLEMANEVKRCWSEINTFQYYEEIKRNINFCLYHSGIDFNEVVENLKYDYEKGTKRSAVANIAAITPGKK